MTAHQARRRPDAAKVLNALAQPLLTVDVEGMVIDVNVAAETFFDMGRGTLLRSRLTDLIPSDSPVLALVAEALSNRATVNGYKIDISTPRIGNRNDVDVFVAPLPQTDDAVAIMLQERAIAEKIDRQLTHRSAARSITALGLMLAHEIKNPLSGIRGAAQLLEASASDDDRALTRLICEETDRIVKLVDRMQSFADFDAVAMGKPQHSCRFGPCQAFGSGRVRAPHPLCRGLRSVASSCAGIPRSTDPGVPESGKERCRSHWKRQR